MSSPTLLTLILQNGIKLIKSKIINVKTKDQAADTTTDSNWRKIWIY